MEKIRIGIFGFGRGSSFVESIRANGGELVAICDKNPRRCAESLEKYGAGVAFYEDFDAFIEHPMDAVLLANYFHEHAPYAIRCLEKGIHVLSECTAASTMAESVALVRAAEKSSAFYMLCENYPFMLFNQEMKRVYETGTLGRVLFAEGEYNHPGAPSNGPLTLFDDMKHWRRFLPRTYYITHSLAPLMYATGSIPRRVTALPIYDPAGASMVGDIAAVVTCLNNDDSVFRVFGHASLGGHGNSYRICGRKGMIENLRGNNNMINLLYNSWDTPEGSEVHSLYKPELNDADAEEIKKAGHGGGDFFVIRKFFECLRTNTRPVMDEHFATTLSSVAILGHRSVMEGGVPYDIPDFHKDEDRVKYENDNESPFWYSDGRAPTIPCCSKPDYRPSKEAEEAFEKRLPR
ncbi:MAG: Gfo/Idh/MocA family oxidoreductase [Oscillospiraceae bacterium]|nr:Gfo/Idh/MocA family oxidoreductase [Oscillospiraceae bacterium]